MILAGIVAVTGIQGCSGTADSAGGDAGTLQLASTASVSGGDLRLVQSLPPPSNSAGGSEQPLSAGDVLEVDVFEVDNLDRTVQVDAAGRISLPLIGAVAAQGKTVRQLEQEIETAYGANYLQSPDVTIFVKESAGQRVTVDGEVANSGLHSVSPNATLIDVIALAGGFRPIADTKKVFVYRDVNGQKLVANYNVQEIRKGKMQDPRIYGGDVIVVFQSQSKVALQNLKEALGVASSVGGVGLIP